MFRVGDTVSIKGKYGLPCIVCKIYKKNDTKSNQARKYVVYYDPTAPPGANIEEKRIDNYVQAAAQTFIPTDTAVQTAATAFNAYIILTQSRRINELSRTVVKLTEMLEQMVPSKPKDKVNDKKENDKDANDNPKKRKS